MGDLRAIIREQADVEDADAFDDPDARHARWQANRPDTTNLSSAMDAEGNPLFKPGDRIVVDRKTKLLRGDPWLETIMGRVKAINLEKGTVSVYDDETDARNPMVKYFSLKDPLTTFKLASGAGGVANTPAVAATPKVPATARPPKASYKIYGKKGGSSAHTRLKGQAYLAPGDTKFKPGDSASLAPEDGKLRVKKDDADQLWEPGEG